MSKRKKQNMEKKPENPDGWTRLSHKNDYPLQYSWGFPGGSDCKESAYNEETQVQSLDQEKPLKKGMAMHSNILAWRISRTEKPG